MSMGNRYYKQTPMALRLLPKPEGPPDGFDYDWGRRVVYRMFEIEQRLEEIEQIRDRRWRIQLAKDEIRRRLQGDADDDQMMQTDSPFCF
jgi:hypothetical protein